MGHATRRVVAVEGTLLGRHQRRGRLKRRRRAASSRLRWASARRTSGRHDVLSGFEQPAQVSVGLDAAAHVRQGAAAAAPRPGDVVRSPRGWSRANGVRRLGARGVDRAARRRGRSGAQLPR
eukprot:7126243-Prymnesium_polylepis.1